MKKAHAQYLCMLSWLLEERRKRDVPMEEESRCAAEMEDLWWQLDEVERADVEARGEAAKK